MFFQRFQRWPIFNQPRANVACFLANTLVPLSLRAAQSLEQPVKVCIAMMLPLILLTGTPSNMTSGARVDRVAGCNQGCNPDCPGRFKIGCPVRVTGVRGPCSQGLGGLSCGQN